MRTDEHERFFSCTFGYLNNLCLADMCQVNEEDEEAFQALKAATNKWVRI